MREEVVRLHLRPHAEFGDGIVDLANAQIGKTECPGKNQRIEFDKTLLLLDRFVGAMQRDQCVGA